MGRRDDFRRAPAPARRSRGRASLPRGAARAGGAGERDFDAERHRARNIQESITTSNQRRLVGHGRLEPAWARQLR